MEEKLARLRAAVAAHPSALVCFSGGVDSTLLLKVANDVLGERCFAVTAVSETMARSEREDAVRLGEELGLGARHVVVESHELERPRFGENPTDRCYLCKTELLDIAAPLAARLGAAAIFLGTNVDDLGDHRPGLAAAAERGALHPMVEAGLTKPDVRALSKLLGLRTWNKPQLACLSSRFPYGTEITPERLRRVDRFEEGLRALGFGQMRVRFHDTIARLELDTAEMARALDPEIRGRIVALGRELGFSYVAVDLAGYRTGAMNEVVGIRTVRSS
ncbi:MAG TPA: ATP-dependent sacrificial sulfur transferase LarE [Haliangiales bacterium]|nr:ATP-dependent sacrificial sulfur transferase LarE [Haliangiales bacterium]